MSRVRSDPRSSFHRVQAQHPSAANAEAFETAVAEVTETTARLLGALPPRRQPPKTVPPLRRPEVLARLGGGK